jgi:serine/threonine protein kinase
MSPEQHAGEAPAERWDIWALTVMAFEMLTGARPFAVSERARVSGPDSEEHPEPDHLPFQPPVRCGRAR